MKGEKRSLIGLGIAATDVAKAMSVKKERKEETANGHEGNPPRASPFHLSSLCVFAALREILSVFFCGFSRDLEWPPHIPARSDLCVKLRILQVLLCHILSQAHIPVPIIRE